MKYGSASARVSKLSPVSARSVTPHRGDPTQGGLLSGSGQEHQCQITPGRVAGKHDLLYSSLYEPAIAGLRVPDCGWERVLRSKSVIGYERIHASAQRDIADEVAERLGCSPVEPAAMQVKERGHFPSLRRSGPPAGYASDRVGLKGDSARGYDALHDAIEGTARGDPFELAFHA
jgi:hypothetical protein